MRTMLNLVPNHRNPPVGWIRMIQDSLPLAEGAKASSQPSADKANTGRDQPIA